MSLCGSDPARPSRLIPPPRSATTAVCERWPPETRERERAGVLRVKGAFGGRPASGGRAPLVEDRGGALRAPGLDDLLLGPARLVRLRLALAHVDHHAGARCVLSAVEAVEAAARSGVFWRRRRDVHQPDAKLSSRPLKTCTLLDCIKVAMEKRSDGWQTGGNWSRRSPPPSGVAKNRAAGGGRRAASCCCRGELTEGVAHGSSDSGHRAARRRTQRASWFPVLPWSRQDTSKPINGQQGEGHIVHGALTRSQLGDGTQQVVVDAGRGVVALAPAHRRRGRRRDQKLFAGLRRGQVGLVDVLVAILDLKRGEDKR
ncbi:hypothetical protein EYF80_010281 [Liparis tanakae]|uniref:Uncharacterized protein n=1 Tax=Liparis tanakae TaxID=230148 RepID=A0A4Z2INU8_9TELE|nr:hypothetical protein EYF80_010281 [Liparis tanakae]